MSGLARLLGYPTPHIPPEMMEKASRLLGKYQQASSVAEFNGLQSIVDTTLSNLSTASLKTDGKVQKLVGAALREWERFLLAEDPNRLFCGLSRMITPEGYSIWTSDENRKKIEADGKEEEEEEEKQLQIMLQMYESEKDEVKTSTAAVEVKTKSVETSSEVSSVRAEKQKIDYIDNPLHQKPAKEAMDDVVATKQTKARSSLDETKEKEKMKKEAEENEEMRRKNAQLIREHDKATHEVEKLERELRYAMERLRALESKKNGCCTVS